MKVSGVAGCPATQGGTLAVAHAKLVDTRQLLEGLFRSERLRLGRDPGTFYKSHRDRLPPCR